jgi:hypothetical protein
MLSTESWVEPIRAPVLRHGIHQVQPLVVGDAQTLVDSAHKRSLRAKDCRQADPLKSPLSRRAQQLGWASHLRALSRLPELA